MRRSSLDQASPTTFAPTLVSRCGELPSLSVVRMSDPPLASSTAMASVPPCGAYASADAGCAFSTTGVPPPDGNATTAGLPADALWGDADGLADADGDADVLGFTVGDADGDAAVAGAKA